MTSAGLLDRLFARPSAPVKAATGIGTTYYSTGVPLSALDQTPQALMRRAQEVYVSNRHVRKAERLIASRFSTVEWHLEMPGDVEVDETAPPAYKAIRDGLEKPYRPLPGDPLTATPRTRTDLWALTCRHMGICGSAFWYLDQADALGGTPLQYLYINPARMWPATNDAGQLVGWVLDHDDRGGGTPLELDRVVQFQLEPPDVGFFPYGLVASALSMVDLTRYADRHASGVLATGGRLAGFVSPKGDDPIPDEVYRQMVLDFRQIADNPDSARRINILKGPVQFDRASATPQELDLVEVMRFSRDEVAELWNVPRSQMGGATPQGLNSGDSKGYDEAILWQNAVGPRLRSFTETLQYLVLDRFAALGLPVELEIEEPEFDDETPLYERASKAAMLPLTNGERREMIGLDPFGDERDDEVWMASTMTRVYPEAEPPPQLAPFAGTTPPPTDSMDDPLDTMPPDLPPPAPPMPMKARGDVDAMQRAVAEVLRRWGGLVAGRVKDRFDHLARKPSDVSAVLDTARLEAELEAALLPHYRATIAGAGTGVQQVLPAAKADLSQPVIDRLLRSAGLRIRGITDTTRQRVQETIAAGIAEGLGAAELGDRLEAAGIFSELRAETIARTETATVLNEAAVAQYRELGVDRVQVVDGDDDDACASVDGAIWTVDEAEANPIAHPNCVRSFTPLIGAPA